MSTETAFVNNLLRSVSEYLPFLIECAEVNRESRAGADHPSLFPGGLASFAVTTGPGSVTVDHVNSGTGLQVFQVVNATNVVVTIPPFTPGTFAPVTATYVIINPALPVDITLRATSAFHGVIVRLRCGTATPTPTPFPGEKVKNFTQVKGQ